MKRIISLIAAVFLLFTCCLSATAKKAYPKPTDNFFVNDFANVLSQDAENKISLQAQNLYYACKAQAVVVTIDTLDGVSIDDYAYDLANDWGIGDKDEDNGILILLAVNDREVRIEVGSGLEGAIPDSKAGRIIDTYGIDYFAVDSFSEGIESVYNSVVNEIYIEYGLSPDENYVPVEEESSVGGIIFSFVFMFSLIALSFALRKKGIFIFPFGFPGGGGGFRGGGGGGFSGGGGGFSGGGGSRNF